MSKAIFVPADLLDALDRKVSCPELERRMVTAFVLGGGGPAKQWATPESLSAAGACWPSNMFNRPVRNVFTILLELEMLGAIDDIAPHLDGWDVTLRKERAA